MGGTSTAAMIVIYVSETAVPLTDQGVEHKNNGSYLFAMMGVSILCKTLEI